MRLPATLLCAALAVATSGTFAQEAKSERHAKMKAAHEQARKACEGRKGDDARECMRREMCAQAKDPAACEARGKAQAERRAKMQEACKGKSGEELKACIREYRSKTTKK